MKTIGVLTSGGDAPGMNAAVRAVVRTAVYHGINVKGIRRGYNGLMEGDIIDLDSRAVSGIIQLGGTMLYSARSPKFKTEEGIKEAVENCKKHGIEGIVVIGGDGSFRGARDLSLAGIPCVGIPATIDNDISSTEYTIGFDTAMNTVIQMVDRLRDTCDSHERCSVVEVMGRHAGHIALRTAIGVGALAVMVPERENDLDAVIEKIKETQKMGKKHFIVVVAEGVGGVTQMAEKIEAATGIESRGTILGHVQRGGSPTLRDRLIATQMGYEAVQLLKEGIGNRVVAYKLGKVVDYDIYEALNMTKELEDNLCLLADITAI
ncbi:MAG: 6-phosphofructokinase [Ruminococcaceae bacterium]|nr:6-phosphofructokinase [Oscillospiraceae bacterium]